MDLEMQVLVHAPITIMGDQLTVSMARTRGRKFVVEIAGPDNVEHYWCDTLDEAKNEFNDCIAANIGELEVPAY